MTQSSADTAGLTHYVDKVNFRRDGDVEARREGWKLFRPNTDLPQGVQALNAGTKLWLLAENVRPNSDRCIIAASKTTIWRYTYATGAWTVIGTGFSPFGRRWQTVAINGWIVLNNAVDLPVSYRVEDAMVTPVRELREVGIASIGWITHYNGFLFGFNIVLVIAAELAGVMGGADPYGLVPSIKTNHIPYRVIWSEFGQPTNWAPVFNITIGAATNTFTVPFGSSIFIAGVTRVAVINGGADGTTLGGDTAHPDGILVTSVVGNVITLEVPTSSGLAYPRQVQITRWTDISAVSAYKDLQGDASHIICAKVLHSTLIIYRTKGIFAARYKAEPGDPFDWKERVAETTNVPIWPDALCLVGDDEYHLYPGKGDLFFLFDGVNPPAVHPVMDEVRHQFFAGITELTDVWAVNNPITMEAWFCRPGFSVCYDYLKKTASEIDAEIDCAAFVTRPGWEEDWFILSIGGVVYTYGRVNGVPTTFHRNGVNPGGRMVWGKGAFGDSFNEKRLRSYQIQFGDEQPEIALRVKLFSSHTASAPLDELINEVLADPANDGGMIPAHFQAIYFQDELHIEGGEDIDVRFVGRLLERSSVRSLGMQRTI